MPIKQITPMSAIDSYTEEQLNLIRENLIRTMLYIGETVLNTARSTNSYRDQTGNLRSSLGYAISIDGKIIRQSDFKTVKQGGEGSKEGAAFVKKLVRKFPKGICLIVVAGMNYAYWVKKRGYDVLDSSELRAEKLVPQLLKQLGFTK
jgi:hypothetical protein